MPLEAKYTLAANLWNHVGPSSKKRLRIGLDADMEQAISAVTNHIESVVIAYKIPENLERRFQWLSSGDMGVKQQLLNYLRQMERSLVIEGARAQLPVMLEHLRADSAGYTTRLAQILKVGKHELELLLDRNSTGVILEEATPIRTYNPTQQRNTLVVWLIIAAVIILGFLLSRHH
jgi:hypothetical protein